MALKMTDLCVFASLREYLIWFFLGLVLDKEMYYEEAVASESMLQMDCAGMRGDGCADGGGYIR
jgi:hypothetical protein